MGPRLRSKKMARPGRIGPNRRNWTFHRKMVRIGRMARAFFHPDRRGLLAGLGASALVSLIPRRAGAQGRIALQAKPGGIGLRVRTDTPIWSLGTPELRFSRGEAVAFDIGNELPVPIALTWRGLDGVAAAAPLTGRPALRAGARESVRIPLRHAGTLFCDMSLLGDGAARPSQGRALVVQESEPVPVDRDQVLLIAEWRVRPDGSAATPGAAAGDAIPIFTVNGRISPDLTCRMNERLRLRFINACERTVIAVKIDQVESRVMAIDGQPAEPFVARNGALVLSPGSRIDAFVDVIASAGSALAIHLHDGGEARPIGRLLVSSEAPVRVAPLPPAAPLPPNGLPARLDLKNALRADLALNGQDWIAPARFTAAQPSFRAKAGRVVVLALTNRAATATVFHLHGHHFRLLDRLDDGWKPFWLDTLAIDPGQTQRIAFAAEHAGSWLMESVAADWAAPRLVRWYAVE